MLYCGLSPAIMLAALSRAPPVLRRRPCADDGAEIPLAISLSSS